MGAKPKNWSLVQAIVAGAGIASTIGYAYAEIRERDKERKAFDALDLRGMSPKNVWEAALAFRRERVRELGTHNRRMENILDQCEELATIAEGFKKCAVIGADRSVPVEVKAAILEHWFTRFCKFFGLTETQVKLVRDDTAFIRYLDRVEQIEEAHRQAMQDPDKCSFCGKSRQEAKVLIAGNLHGMAICDTCTDLANGLVVQQRERDDAAAQARYSVEDWVDGDKQP
jgi:hypothetical protein